MRASALVDILLEGEDFDMEGYTRAASCDFDWKFCTADRLWLDFRFPIQRLEGRVSSVIHGDMELGSIVWISVSFETRYEDSPRFSYSREWDIRLGKMSLDQFKKTVEDWIFRCSSEINNGLDDEGRVPCDKIHGFMRNLKDELVVKAPVTSEALFVGENSDDLDIEDFNMEDYARAAGTDISWKKYDMRHETTCEYKFPLHDVEGWIVLQADPEYYTPHSLTDIAVSSYLEFMDLGVWFREPQVDAGMDALAEVIPVNGKSEEDCKAIADRWLMFTLEPALEEARLVKSSRTIDRLFGKSQFKSCLDKLYKALAT